MSGLFLHSKSHRRRRVEGEKRKGRGRRVTREVERILVMWKRATGS